MKSSSMHLLISDLFVPYLAEASSQLEGQLPNGYNSDGFNGGNFGVHQPAHLDRNSEGKTYGAVFVIVGESRQPGFEARSFGSAVPIPNRR